MQSQIEFLPAQYDLCIVFSKMRSSLRIQSPIERGHRLFYGVQGVIFIYTVWRKMNVRFRQSIENLTFLLCLTAYQLGLSLVSYATK